MKRIESILLLFVMVVTLLPWQAFCASHPMGHEHHEHDGPTLCELRKMDTGEVPGFWAPMDCEHISPAIGDYTSVQHADLSAAFELVAVVAVLFQLTEAQGPKQLFVLPPDPNCRSGTLLSDEPLRGPPLV